MAERIDSIVPAPRGRPALYPWETWTDGSIWRIRQGEDFEVSGHSMATQIRLYADRTGISVTATQKGDVVEFQFDAQAAA